MKKFMKNILDKFSKKLLNLLKKKELKRERELKNIFDKLNEKQLLKYLINHIL